MIKKKKTKSDILSDNDIEELENILKIFYKEEKIHSAIKTAILIGKLKNQNKNNQDKGESSVDNKQKYDYFNLGFIIAKLDPQVYISYIQNKYKKINITQHSETVYRPLNEKINERIKKLYKEYFNKDKKFDKIFQGKIGYFWE